MGNVCHEFLLVILRTGNLACHVGDGGAEVANLILAVNLKFILHVASSILLSGFRNFAQRKIDHLCEEDQNNHGEQK